MTLFVAVLVAGMFGLGGWLWTPDKSRADLELRYLAAPDDIETVAGGRLHVRDSGPSADDAAASIVLIHGFGASLHTWEEWAGTLAQDYRVIRFDLPGSGLSYPDPGNDYSDERAMELVLALLDARGIERAHLIGNSIGGRLAWRLAAAHPERVGKVVLVSPDGFASQGFEYGKAPEVPLMLQAMRYVLPKPILRSNLKPAYADPAKFSDETLTRYHDLMLTPGSREALLARMGQTILVPPEPLLATIQAPVLLLWGEQDALIPVANAQDYLAVLPDARLVVLPNLGHVPQEEDPARSLEPVLEFLKP